MRVVLVSFFCVCVLLSSYRMFQRFAVVSFPPFLEFLSINVFDGTFFFFFFSRIKSLID